MKKLLKKILNRVLAWRMRHVNNKNFLIVASGLVGITAGITAIVLKVLVHFIEDTLQQSTAAEKYNWLYLFFPLVGLVLTVAYVQKVRKGKLGRGISNIIYAINRKSGNVERDKMYSHVITSALTVGFGGSSGLEAPIVVTGSAIGSNIAKALRLTVKERVVLLASGAAAGIAAVFNAPIGGVIFAMEVLLPEFTIPAFIPLLIASAFASVISGLTHSEQLFMVSTEGWAIHNIPFYLLLGGLCGLVCVYMIRLSLRTEGYLKKLPFKYRKAVLGGIGLSMMIFLLPVLYGEGYSTVRNLINGNYSFLFNNTVLYAYRGQAPFILLMGTAIVLVKVLATSLTIGAGGNGGIFAPSLFTGAVLGYTFSVLIGYLGLGNLNTSNFIVAGMTGILAGVVHAPLTAIFLIAEVTGGYQLFVPLMMVSAISFFITRYFEPFSIYTKQLAARGHLATRDKDLNLLQQLRIDNLIEKDFKPVQMDMTLGEMVGVIASCKRNIFPVLDENKKLLGMVYLDNIREMMFNTNLYDQTRVREMYTPVQAFINMEDSMPEAMQKFERHKAWNLPVISNGQYIGFLSKSAIFNEYRKLLVREGRADELPL